MGGMSFSDKIAKIKDWLGENGWVETSLLDFSQDVVNFYPGTRVTTTIVTYADDSPHEAFWHEGWYFLDLPKCWPVRHEYWLLDEFAFNHHGWKRVKVSSTILSILEVSSSFEDNRIHLPR